MRLQSILCSIMCTAIVTTAHSQQSYDFAQLRGSDLIKYSSDKYTKRHENDALDINLSGIQDALSAYNTYNNIRDSLIQSFSQHYENDPQECLKQFRMILSEELGCTLSLVQQVQIYLSSSDVITDKDHLNEVMSILSELNQSIQQAQYRLPSPATPGPLIHIGVELSTYCEFLQNLLYNNFSKIPYIPSVSYDDIADSGNIKNTAIILIENARHLNHLDPMIQNIHLTWYNKAYRTLCAAANKLPNGTLSWTSAALVSGSCLAGLYALPEPYANKIGLSHVQKTLFGPYLDEDDPNKNIREREEIREKLYATLNSSEQNSEQQGVVPQGQSNWLNSVVQQPQQETSQQLGPQAAKEFKHQKIIKDTLEHAQQNETNPFDEFEQRYTSPYSWFTIGAGIFSGCTTFAKIAGEYLYTANQFAQINNHLGGIYKKIAEKFYNLHNFLKGIEIEDTHSLQYIENLTLDDPRFDTIRESLYSLTQLELFMQDPHKYMHEGSNIPRSILITGPSGSGKSFVAQAFAGSLNQKLQDKTRFWNLEKTDWAHIKSLGARNAAVEIIESAKACAPCVIFMDEVHTYNLQNNGDSTFLNELLQALDSIDLNKNPDEQVFVLAATNRPEVVDGALLRDKRFGERITLSNPGFEQRKTILKTRCEQLAINTDNIDFDYIASLTSGAPLSTLEKLFEDAIFLARRDNMAVSFVHFYIALNRTVRKIIPTCSLQTNEQNTIATNIAAQAIIQYHTTPEMLDAITLCPVDKKVREVSWIFDKTESNSQSNPHELDYGHIYTHHTYEKIGPSDSATQRNTCKQLLAGKIAEEIINGSRSTYRPEDTIQAFQKAIEIVCDGIPFDQLSRNKQDEKRDEAQQLFLEIQNEARNEVNQHYDEIVRLRDTLLQEYFVHKPLMERIINNTDVDQACATA